MKFQTNFSNSSLYKKKVELLKEVIDSLPKYKKQLDQQILCDYHGEQLCFSTRDNTLREDFSRIIPSNWIKEKLDNPHSILIFSPVDFGISIEEWQDEPSQDCFIDPLQKSAIQRDFISYQISENETILICSNRLDDGLNNFLRWFLPRRLLKRDILVFHSSCVIENEKAKLFLGHSGAGKSTMVSLREDRKHLSDDMNLIIKKNGKFYAQAGAIGGLFFDKVDYSMLYPIESFSWLIQDTFNESRALKTSKAYIKAMVSVSNVFWESLEDDQTKKIMNSVQDITKNIKFFELHFTKSKEVWNYVD